MLVGAFTNFFPLTTRANRKQTLNSFGLGYKLVGDNSFKTRVLDGADSLYDFRYEVRSRWLLDPSSCNHV